MHRRGGWLRFWRDWGAMVAEQIKPLDAKTIGASTYAGRKPQTLIQAAKHNLRAIQKELGANSHIDATRICLNEIMAGPDTPAGVAALALSLMAAAGVEVSKLRKDHTQAHELLFTLSADTTVNTQDYFGRCLAWVGDQFGHDNILSAVVHLDEAAPHLHILIVPVQDGRYLGTSLIDRARLKKLRALFAAEVAPTFGLKVMEPLTGARRSRAIEAIYDRLKTTQNAILQNVLWDVVKADIVRNPARYMARLGITHVPVNDGGAEFRRIALSTGKGGKTERRAKPYGFESGVSDDVVKPYGFEADPENHRNPPCVGFPSPTPPATSPQPAPATPSIDQWFDDVDQPLSDTPDEHGEVAAPARTEVIDHLATRYYDVTATPASQHLPDGDGVTLPDTQDLDQPNEIESEDDGFVEPTRVVRDCDLDPNQFHDGEYCPRPPPAPRLKRQAADQWVSAALASRSKPTPRPCVHRH